jgi:hypothetical protein
MAKVNVGQLVDEGKSMPLVMTSHKEFKRRIPVKSRLDAE